MSITFESGRGVAVDGEILPGGVTAMRFLFALMATGGTRVR